MYVFILSLFSGKGVHASTTGIRIVIGSSPDYTSVLQQSEFSLCPDGRRSFTIRIAECKLPLKASQLRFMKDKGQRIKQRCQYNAEF